MTLVQYDAARARDVGEGVAVARRAWVDLMAPAVELANAIAGTDFVPRSIRGNVPAIAAAILYGDEVGLGPMAALSMVAVVDGRPTLYAEAQRGLILAAGHEIWPENVTNTSVTFAGRRAGEEIVTRVTWTLDDARAAGLLGKQNYRNYPRQMLAARSSAELARLRFADVTHGLAALEEFDAGADDEGVPTKTGDGAERTASRARRRRNPAASPRPLSVVAAAGSGATNSTSAPLPPLPGEDDSALTDAHTPDASSPAMITAAQTRMLHASYRRRGITEKRERAAYASRITGRDVASSKDLTVEEASRVIDALEAGA